YTHQYESTWVAPKFEYIHKKILEYNYQINLKKSFKFSLCGQCYSILLKLNSTKTKKKLMNKTTDVVTDNAMNIVMDNATDELTDVATDVASDVATDVVSDVVTDIVSDASSSFSLSVITNDEIISSDDNTKFEISYKLIVKTAEGTSLPAKWFKESASTVDEFLLSIHNKIIVLVKDNILLLTDYNVAFKTPRKTGAGTQLADA
ncbi:875_t:CDS:2, partial [Racocetra fulgida]